MGSKAEALEGLNLGGQGAAADDSDPVSGHFFGQYLVEQGVISPTQLDEAVALQKENNTLLGLMALEKGYLNQTQLETVLAEQRQVNQRFGQIAMDKGWMNEDQVNSLLADQSKNHCFLGEALIRLGILNQAVLHDHLERFRDMEQAREKNLLEAISNLQGSRMFLPAVDLIRDFFCRMGYMLKAVEVQTDISKTLSGECFLAAQKGKGHHVDYVGLVLTPKLIELMAQGNLCRPRKSLNLDEQLDTVAELIFNFNVMLCSELKDLGIKLKPGQVLNRSVHDLPRHSSGMAVTFSTVADPVVLMYCLQ